MARRVYFAFHYEDVADFRANAVRNSWLTKRRDEDAIFFDASLWEKVKKERPIAIKRMINSGLQNTSVTAVLTGTQTYTRPWVRYEIVESFKKSNGLITIHINSIPDKQKTTYPQGPNPLDYLYFRIENGKINLWEWELKNEEWRFLESINKREVNYRFGDTLEGHFSVLFPSYDWMGDDGYNNFSDWVEYAAVFAGK